MLRRTSVLSAAVLVLLATAARPDAARRPAAEPCTGRYLAPTALLLPDGDAVDVAPTRATLGDVCRPVRPKTLRATKRGTTKVRVLWRTCAGVRGRVKLRGEIVDGCTRLVGTLRGKRLRKPVDALRSRCGDGRLDVRGAEQCEPPDTPACDQRCAALPPVSTTTTLPGPLDVWRPATVPFDPTCATGCTEVSRTAPLGHFQGTLRLRVNPAVDDPVAQWGDCLESVLVCYEADGALAACVAQAQCPPDCKTLFAEAAAGAADDEARVAAFEAVFVGAGAPCRPEAEP
jgi:hypothetical protein